MRNIYETGNLLPYNANGKKIRHTKKSLMAKHSNNNLTNYIEADCLRKIGYLESYIAYLSTKIYEVQFIHHPNQVELNNINDLIKSESSKETKKSDDFITFQNCSKTCKLYFLFLLISNFFILSANGQDLIKNKFKPLNIGDSIPEVIWQTPMRIVNHPDGKDTIRLNDYRNKKLLILNFWATWCGPCVQKLPNVYETQLSNPNDFKILLVNTLSSRDNADKVADFLNKRKQAYDFYSVVEDEIFNQMFPHKSVPHYVWIFEGKLYASTSSDMTQPNIENIRRFLKVQNFTEILEQEKVIYDYTKPLFIEQNGGEPNSYIYRSFLKSYEKDLISSFFFNYEKGNKISRISATNTPLLDLYKMAYPLFANFYESEIIYDIDEASVFKTDYSSEAWKSKNLFIYEAIFPSTSIEQGRKIMQSDLNRYFGYSVDTLSLLVDVLVINCKDSSLIKRPVQLERKDTNLYEKSGIDIFYNNYPLEPLIHELERIYKMPVIDRSGIVGNVNLILPADINNLELLKESLMNNGFILSKEKITRTHIRISKK